MTRTLQFLGLLLIGLLSFEAETVRAAPSGCDIDDEGCEVCKGDECDSWFCPIGNDRGVGIVCDEE